MGVDELVVGDPGAEAVDDPEAARRERLAKQLADPGRAVGGVGAAVDDVDRPAAVADDPQATAAELEILAGD